MLIIELRRTSNHPRIANVEAMANMGDPTEVPVNHRICFIEKSLRAILKCELLSSVS